MTGKVSVTGEPTYKATLKSVAFDGKKMTVQATTSPPMTPPKSLLAANLRRQQGHRHLVPARQSAPHRQSLSGTWTCTKRNATVNC